MARMATSSSSRASQNSGFSVDRLKGWADDHREAIKVGACAAAVAFFFTHGLPLWDDDYSLWLTQANEGFFSLILRLISPITSEPQAWGYSDRPVQVLIYRILSLFFGNTGTPYFLVKSIGFGALVGAAYEWMRREKIERHAAWIALALFALSANTMSSMIWHSDFGVYSQLVLVLTLAWALPQVRKGPSSMAIYQKGWEGIPDSFKRFCLTFFAAVYFGAKLKGDVRLAPVILLAYLWTYHRERAKVYTGPMVATFLATLPWSTQMFKSLPPFLGGASTGWSYGQFSIGRVVEFLAGDMFNVTGAPLSVIGGYGLLAALAAAAYVGYKLYKEELSAPDEEWGFYLIWFGIAVVSCGLLARQSAIFQLRYTLIPLVPATMLAARGLGAAMGEFKKVPYLRHAVLAVAVLQCGAHLYHDVQVRRDMGHTMIAVDKMYSAVAQKFPNAQLVFAPGFIPYGYRAENVPAIKDRKAMSSNDELAGYKVGNTVIASWSPSLDVRLTMDTPATGCGANLFDTLFPCKATESAFLSRFIGAPAEVAQAEQMDRQGNLRGALQTVTNYLQRDPTNHGVAFVAGLYAYRLGDFAQMERIYDGFGAYLEYHPSVVYNWGLAKQGVQKYAEASKYLEKAYAMAPKDYGIGFNLADSYFRQGKKSRALAMVNELLQVYPGNPGLKNAQQEWSKQ